MDAGHATGYQLAISRRGAADVWREQGRDPISQGMRCKRGQRRQIADEWNEQLRCPNCSKTGIASLDLSAKARPDANRSIRIRWL